MLSNPNTLRKSIQNVDTVFMTKVSSELVGAEKESGAQIVSGSQWGEVGGPVEWVRRTTSPSANDYDDGNPARTKKKKEEEALHR